MLAVSWIRDATVNYKDGQLLRINGETGEAELIQSYSLIESIVTLSVTYGRVHPNLVYFKVII